MIVKEFNSTITKETCDLLNALPIGIVIIDHPGKSPFFTNGYFLFLAKTLTIGFVVGLLSCKTALSISGDSAHVLDILPRGFAKSALATLLISVVLTILL